MQELSEHLYLNLTLIFVTWGYVLRDWYIVVSVELILERRHFDTAASVGGRQGGCHRLLLNIRRCHQSLLDRRRMISGF